MNKDLQSKLETFYHALQGEASKKGLGVQVNSCPKANWMQNAWLYIIYGVNVMQQAFIVYQTHNGELYWDKFNGSIPPNSIEKEVKCEERNL